MLERVNVHPASAPTSTGSLGREDRWYAVQCRPHSERKAAAHLSNQDFAVFLPVREKTRRHARRIETVRVPFFPGYLFVRFDVSKDRWRSVNGTVGVVRLVMQGDVPAPAPPGIVEAFVKASGESGILSWRPQLEAGQQVRVIAGPFAELIGRLESMTDAGRLRVLLDIMGGQIPIVLPEENVAPADSLL